MISEFPNLVNAKFDLRAGNDANRNLFGWCNCSEDEFRLGPFSVRVFIRYVDIELSLEGCVTNYDSWFAADMRPTSAQITFESENETTDRKSKKDNAEGSLSSDNSSGIAIGFEQQYEKSIKNYQKFSLENRVNFVVASGSETHARWRFIKAQNETHIDGFVLKNTKLASISNSKKCKIEVYVKIPKFGIFTSPSRFNSIREQRKCNIFAIIVRKKLSGKYKVISDDG